MGSDVMAPPSRKAFQTSGGRCDSEPFHTAGVDQSAVTTAASHCSEQQPQEHAVRALADLLAVLGVEAPRAGALVYRRASDPALDRHRGRIRARRRRRPPRPRPRRARRSGAARAARRSSSRAPCSPRPRSRRRGSRRRAGRRPARGRGCSAPRAPTRPVDARVLLEDLLAEGRAGCPRPRRARGSRRCRRRRRLRGGSSDASMRIVARRGPYL